MKKRSAMRMAVMALTLFMASAPYAGAAPKAKMFGYLDKATGQSFVPIRFFSELSGASVSWNEATQQVAIAGSGTQVSLNVGRTAAVVNGEKRELSAAPFSEKGVTYVPLRLVTDALGLDAAWDPSLASVKLHLSDREVTLPVVERGSQAASPAPFARETKSFEVGGHRLKAELLTVALLDPNVDLSVALAGGKVGATAELKSIADRAGAKAAINGTFFDAYTDSGPKNPYGYIAAGGEIVWKAPGDKRTVLLFDANDNVEFVNGADFLERFEQGGVEGALQAGPWLVRDGKVDLNVQEEGFKDPKILTGGGARSAVGVTRDHKLLLATVPGATIPQLAEIMKQAGALQAMNLDGGASSGLYYNGKYVTKPGRPISNALVISG